jgi:hypothetical protein
MSVMLAVFGRINLALRKSITCDNDPAFAQHALLRTMRAMTTARALGFSRARHDPAKDHRGAAAPAFARSGSVLRGIGAFYGGFYAVLNGTKNALIWFGNLSVGFVSRLGLALACSSAGERAGHLWRISPGPRSLALYKKLFPESRQFIFVPVLSSVMHAGKLDFYTQLCHRSTSGLNTN